MLSSRNCAAFIAVAETGSFEKAASCLSITASAVTLRVQNLEKSLGQTLIVRERPCRPTAKGQILFEYLQHQQLQEQQVLHQLRGKNDSSNFYQVKVATNADSLETWLLPRIQPLLLQQQMTLHLHIDDQSHTHQLMESGQVNACISSIATPMKGCQSQLIMNMRYALVCTPAFKARWFQQECSREQFRRAPAVVFNDKDQLHDEVMRQHFGLTMHTYPYFYVPSSAAFVQAIKLGLSYGMVPELQIQQELAQQQLIRLLPQVYVDVPLYWHHWKSQSEQLHLLTQIILEQGQTLASTQLIGR